MSKILLFTIFILNFHNAQARLKHDQLVQLKISKLNFLNKKYRHIRVHGEEEYKNFKNKYLDNYLTPERRKHSYKYSLREVISFTKNRTQQPKLNYNLAIDLVNVFLQFNSPDDHYTILIDGKNENKVLFRSLIFYTIGILAELNSGRTTYIEKTNEYEKLIEIIVNSVTPYFEPGGAGKSTVNNFENAYFKFIISLNANFSINLTDKIFTHLSPKKDDSEGIKIVKATFFMELLSYCTSHCTNEKNYIGIYNTSSKDQSIYHLLKSSFKEKIYKSNYAQFQFQRYIPTLLEYLDVNNDDFNNIVRSEIALMVSKSHLKNIQINYKSYANNATWYNRVILLFKYVTTELLSSTKHFIVWLAYTINLPILVFSLCIFFLVFLGENPIKKINLQTKALVLSSNKTIAILRKIINPFWFIFNFIKVLLLKIWQNIISTYKDEKSSLIYKIAVQGLIISATIYFSFIKDYLLKYHGD